MRTLFFILLCITLKGQIKFPELVFDDKFQHNMVGMTTAIIVGEITYQVTDLEGLSSAVGTAFGISITVAKEYIYDRYLKLGVFSVGDIIAGCMGALTGGMIHRVIIDLRYKHEQKKLIKISNAKRLLD